MKTLMIATAVSILATGVMAGTVVKEGPNGTSVITRSVENGVLTTTETWTGKDGGVYSRETVCENSRCTTGWTLNDRKGRMSSGERDTVYGNGQSTTRATVTGPRGNVRERTINRTRSVTR